ncbi:MAG: peptidase U62 [Deltaproteobacteria bacterium]|nr:peptidase U62 [Deltaproteobacteria bacterium]MBK8236218.1 peptidase U62 [Deltaproteobacteria bacterium]MBP7291045.1 TldD/PmbA family protein [Nannocystaceae bacterium]
MTRRALPFLVFAAPLLALSLSCQRHGTNPPERGGRGGGRAMQLQVVRPKAPTGDPSPVLEILERELQQNLTQLTGDGVEQSAYFLAYDLVAQEQLWIAAEDGALVRDEQDSDRTIDVDVRVGSRKLDNSHSRDGDYGPGNGLGSGLSVSLDDDELSLAQGLWLATEAQYHNAVSALREVESDEELRSDDDQHPDFSVEKPTRIVQPEREFDFAAAAEKLRPLAVEVSQVLGADPRVLSSSVSVTATLENHYFVNTEGTRVQSGRVLLRILLQAGTQAEDGMRLGLTETFEAHTLAQLPTREKLVAAAEKLRGNLIALQTAPIADPYTGPAVLEGRAAGVFFHEIFGHRLEGHRQKDDAEGQTFTDQLGKSVLPKFLDVVDDPTIAMLGEQPLSGHYYVDDEGVPAQRTAIVERGKLKTFLLGRSPVRPFMKSNGHGRREPGYQVVARQGNLVVSSRKALSRKQLRAALLEEVERQDKPYGLWFTDISGGYTLTDRSGPQAFKVEPLLVYRVFADGRPDELVRGVEMVGTPLQAFETILATDDQPGIFNGVCGAESGWVPVSAVSPSLLLRNLEIERGVHDRDKPPLLEPPGTSDDGARKKGSVTR